MQLAELGAWQASTGPRRPLDSGESGSAAVRRLTGGRPRPWPPVRAGPSLLVEHDTPSLTFLFRTASSGGESQFRVIEPHGRSARCIELLTPRASHPQRSGPARPAMGAASQVRAHGMVCPIIPQFAGRRNARLWWNSAWPLQKGCGGDPNGTLGREAGTVRRGRCRGPSARLDEYSCFPSLA